MAKEKLNDDPNSLLSKPWRKFFDKFNEIDQLNVSQWKEVHMLAYFSRRYEKLYGKKYSITIKNAPTKCPDMFMIKKIIATVGTTNMNTIKNYIDWVYDKKIVPNNRKIRSLGYFITAGFANEFKFDISQAKEIKRSTEIPKEYKEITSALGIEASTYGDLAFIKMAINKYDHNFNNIYVQLFANLEALGLEPEILEKLG